MSVSLSSLRYASLFTDMLKQLRYKFIAASMSLWAARMIAQQ